MTQGIDIWQQSLDFIHDNPREWYQRSWGFKFVCGTAYCLAGTAARIKAEMDGSVRFRWQSDEAFDVIVIDGYGTSVVSIENYAAQLFEISQHDAGLLFSARNTMDQLFALSYVLSGQRIKLPAEVYNVRRGSPDPKLHQPFIESVVAVEPLIMSESMWAQQIEYARDSIAHSSTYRERS